MAPSQQDRPAATENAHSLPLPQVGVARPSSADRTPDALVLSAMVLSLLYVWRLQDLYPVLATLQLPTLSALAAYGLLFIDKRPDRRLKELKSPTARWLLILGVAIVCSAVFGTYISNSLDFIRADYWKTFVLFFVIAASIRNFHDAENMMAVQALGATIYSAVILTRFEVDESGRLGNLEYYDANDLAFLMVMTVPLATYFLRPGARRWQQMVALTSLVLILLSIAKSGSRGGFLGLLVVLGMILLRYRAFPTMTRLVTVVVMFAGLAIAGGDKYWDLMRTMLNPSADYNFAADSEHGRGQVWKRGIGYALDRPLLGVGVANFGYAEGFLSRVAGQRAQFGYGTRETAAHNSFVQIVAELGFAGLGAFVALLALSMRFLTELGRRVLRSRPELAAMCLSLSIALAGYCSSGFFLSQGYSAYLYVILGIVAGLYKTVRLAKQQPLVRR